MSDAEQGGCRKDTKDRSIVSRHKQDQTRLGREKLPESSRQEGWKPAKGFSPMGGWERPHNTHKQHTWDVITQQKAVLVLRAPGKNQTGTSTPGNVRQQGCPKELLRVSIYAWTVHKGGQDDSAWGTLGTCEMRQTQIEKNPSNLLW